MKKPGRLF